MEYISANTVISFLALNSIFSFIVFLLFWPLRRFLFKNNFNWKQALWVLILVRLFLPLDSDFGFNPLNLLSSSFHADVSITNFNETYFPGLENGSLQDEDIVRPFFTLPTIVLIFWVSGVVLSFLLFLRLRLKFKNIVKNSISTKNPFLKDSFYKWQKQFQVSRNVEIKESKLSTIPFTTGIFKPQIIIPTTMIEKGSAIQLETIIAHEMAHIKKYDDLQLLILAIIQSIYFFNPIVWFVVKELSQLREKQCDRFVLQQGTLSAREYGLSLLKTAGKSLSPGLVFVVAMSDSKKRIRNRINAIKGDLYMKTKFKPVMFVLLIFLTFTSMSLSNPFNKIDRNINFSESGDNVKLVKSIEFQNPLKEYKVTSAFGPQLNPITKKRRHHDGIDLKSPKGTNIFAAESGTVIFSGSAGGYGKTVRISHVEGFKTMYAHLSKYFVQEGQIVSKGDVIGLVGNTGLSTAPHLHFEIRKNDKPVNPKDYVKF